jgi:hypothetical protein
MSEVSILASGGFRFATDFRDVRGIVRVCLVRFAFIAISLVLQRITGGDNPDNFVATPHPHYVGHDQNRVLGDAAHGLPTFLATLHAILQH